nr:hypothetical protein CFP56_24635 [Quercus suber]
MIVDELSCNSNFWPNPIVIGQPCRTALSQLAMVSSQLAANSASPYTQTSASRSVRVGHRLGIPTSKSVSKLRDPCPIEKCKMAENEVKY